MPSSARLKPSYGAELVLFPIPPTADNSSGIGHFSLLWAMILKWKLLVNVRRPKKVFEPDPDPKNIPIGSKKAKKGQIKNERIGLYFQNQKWYSTLVGPKEVFEPDSNP